MVKIVQDIKTGAALFFKGQRYIAHHKELLKLAAIPLIAGSLIWALGIYLFITHFGQLADFLWSRPDSMWLLYIWYVAASLLFAISFFTVTLITYLLFMIIAAPFNDLISERVENLENTFESKPFNLKFFLKDAWNSMLLELLKAVRKFLWIAFFYIISLIIPVLGQLIYLIAGNYKLSHMFGMDYTDWSLARRGYSYKDRFKFASKNRWTLAGFGLMVVTFSLIPFGALIIWPGAVAGGTLLCSDLKPDDKTLKS